MKREQAKAEAAADQENARLRDAREASPDGMTASERAMSETVDAVVAGNLGDGITIPASEPHHKRVTKYRESHPDVDRLIDELIDRGCRCYIDFGETIGDASRGDVVMHERCRCWNTNAGPLWLYERWKRCDGGWKWCYSEWMRAIEGSHKLGVDVELLAGESRKSK